MDRKEIDWLVYVDVPDWKSPAGPSDWRHYIPADLRGKWSALTYEQKWGIAQNAGKLAHRAYERLRGTPVYAAPCSAELDSFQPAQSGACAPATTPSWTLPD